MSKTNIKLQPFVFIIPFWIFIFIKVAGTTLANWSWFWLFLPIIPIAAFVFEKLHWTI